VPVRIIATRKIIQHALGDVSFSQAMNVACLPGVEDAVVIMPDVHQGYGFPIGAVAAMRMNDGVVSPGGIGYDINCGVRLMASQVHRMEVKDKLDQLAIALDLASPSGVGATSRLALSKQDFEHVCMEGVRWAHKKGLATDADLRRTEGAGCLSGQTWMQSVVGQLSGVPINSGRLVQGTTFWKWIMWKRSSPNPPPVPMGCSRIAWWCKSIADRGDSVTRFAQITYLISICDS